jgi:hypothetical protein
MSHALWEYPDIKLVQEQHADTLASTLDKYGGILPLAHRFAGRTFCTPGRRLRLNESALYPTLLNGVGLDELWIVCTTPIVTGTVDITTGRAPFREGEAHVYTADGTLVSFQELIETNPRLIIGTPHEEFTRATFGKPTWGIVSKFFDNLNPIPHHLHWSKWEVYDINRLVNGPVHPSHYFTTAMGLYPWVTKEVFLETLSKFGQPGGNGIRKLSPHVMVPVDEGGFCMPNGVLHSPTNLATHEVHILMDEHFLAEDLTQDGSIPLEAAFLACREVDYPKAKHGDWEYLTSIFNFEANQDPDFVLKNSRPPKRDETLSSEGVEATWIVYGPFGAEQRCSIMRLTLAPGVRCALPLASPCVFHTNQGSGRIGKYDVHHATELSLGVFQNELGFITQSAIDSSQGVEFTNTGAIPFTVTLDFAQNGMGQS